MQIFDVFNRVKPITISRLWNMLCIVISYTVSILLRKNFHVGYPVNLSIEPSSYCNLKCLHCPTGSRTLKRPQGNMDFDAFKTIIDKQFPYLMSIILYFQGEPFFNRQIIDMIKYAKRKKLYVYISTNAHFIDERLAYEIVKSGLDKIIISLDGVSQDVYSAYRKSGELSKVTAAIKHITESKKILNSKTPFLEAQFIVFKSNEHEIDKAKDFCKTLEVNKLSFKSAQVYDVQNNIDAISTINKYSRYIVKNGQAVLKKKLKNRCFRMWYSAVLTWDGLLAPCCYDKDANAAFGNINEVELNSLWKSPKYNEFRSQILKNRKKIEICRTCNG